MLRKIRLTLAVLCFATVTLLFLDFTGTLHTWLGWTAKIQFLPALLALNVGIVGFFVLVTLVFGRVYCSVICPLGVMQDIIAWMGKKTEEEPLLLFSGQVMAAVWGVGSFRCSDDSWNRFTGGIARAIQFMRTDRKQSVHPVIRLGKQSARLLCGTRRQLRLL